MNVRFYLSYDFYVPHYIEIAQSLTCLTTDVCLTADPGGVNLLLFENDFKRILKKVRK